MTVRSREPRLHPELAGWSVSLASAKVKQANNAVPRKATHYM